MSGKDKIVSILMKRDGLSKEEAGECYDNTYAELMDAICGTSCLDPEEVLSCELGLEPDYLDYFIM